MRNIIVTIAILAIYGCNFQPESPARVDLKVMVDAYMFLIRSGDPHGKHTPYHVMVDMRGISVADRDQIFQDLRFRGVVVDGDEAKKADASGHGMVLGCSVLEVHPNNVVIGASWYIGPVAAADYRLEFHRNGAQWDLVRSEFRGGS